MHAFGNICGEFGIWVLRVHCIDGGELEVVVEECGFREKSGSSPWRWMFRCVMTQSARVGHSLEATHGVGCSGVGALEFRPPVGPLIPRRRIAPRNPADYIFIRVK
ncbi:Glutamate receptor family protein [Prunus dulcis]|uniref:Glutamate receptor family protein n=1 Tax=Prunus dulcis TaxID=3755 RepID=A0A5H2XI88_PRUDU|nr:Glutamate receptor family protein [Prunus dulcis]